MNIGDRVMLIKDGSLMCAIMDKGDTGVIIKMSPNSIYVKPDYGNFSDSAWRFTKDFLTVIDSDNIYEDIDQNDLLEIINYG